MIAAINTNMATYRGFSTVNAQSQKKFRLTDLELIKQDLFNRLNTRRGERVMLPGEGCVIWELIHEPFTASLKTQIVENLRTLVNADPRLSLQSLEVISLTDQSAIVVELNVEYSLTNQVELLTVLFDELGTATQVSAAPTT